VISISVTPAIQSRQAERAFFPLTTNTPSLHPFWDARCLRRRRCQVTLELPCFFAFLPLLPNLGVPRRACKWNPRRFSSPALYSCCRGKTCRDFPADRQSHQPEVLAPVCRRGLASCESRTAQDAAIQSPSLCLENFPSTRQSSRRFLASSRYDVGSSTFTSAVTTTYRECHDEAAIRSAYPTTYSPRAPADSNDSIDREVYVSVRTLFRPTRRGLDSTCDRV